jgi:hypothetical protein
MKFYFQFHNDTYKLLSKDGWSCDKKNQIFKKDFVRIDFSVITQNGTKTNMPCLDMHIGKKIFYVIPRARIKKSWRCSIMWRLQNMNDVMNATILQAHEFELILHVLGNPKEAVTLAGLPWAATLMEELLK